jgi:hypothetical protein
MWRRMQRLSGSSSRCSSRAERGRHHQHSEGAQGEVQGAPWFEDSVPRPRRAALRNVDEDRTNVRIQCLLRFGHRSRVNAVSWQI